METHEENKGNWKTRKTCEQNQDNLWQNEWVNPIS